MPYCGKRDDTDMDTVMDTDMLTLTEVKSSAGDDARTFSLPGDTPRYAPDRPADVRHVDIDVRLDFERKSVSGTVTTSFNALFEQVREIAFDAAELDIERVTMAGSDTPLDFWAQGEKLHVRLDRGYHHGEEFGVAVRYAATPRIGLVFVGPEPGNPDLPVQAWTQGETEYHHFWFPCHDFPNDRATTSLRATVPGSFFALSNGRLEETHENGDGTRTYSWRMEVPFPAYLVTLVAGEFSEIPDAWRNVPVNYYVRPGCEDDGRRMLGKTPAMIEFFSQRFGVNYPYVKYGQIVPELFLGAMENASATTHSYRLLGDRRAYLDWDSEPVVAHELVHQWHGDLLAVRDWSHTWLKEGFATYFETTWIEHDKGTDEFRAELRANLHAYLDADRRGRRPIVYNVYHKNATELYDRNVYQKASLVLHMLRYVLGEEPFWRGVQLYTGRNQGREVITADFERAMEEATGRSLARFFEQWIYKPGHPEFKVHYSWDDEQHLAKLSVEQTQKTDDETPMFVTPIEIGFMVPDSEGAPADGPDVAFTLQTFRVTIDEARQTFYFPLARRPLSVRFDQDSWLLKTLDFERPAELSRFQLRHDPDVLGRIEAAEALGKLADPQSITALERALAEEPFWLARDVIAEALASQKSARALNALLAALERLDPIVEPKARRGIVAALGAFRAPEHADLAERAAEALARIVREGDPSYFVEAEACVALGKTRVPGAYATLLEKVDTPSWREMIRGGVFMGLGELGDPRVVDVLAGWLLDRTKPMDARAAAAGGFAALARTGRIDPASAAHTQAVDTLIAALEDPWELTQRAAVHALALWADQGAIPALERVVERTLDERTVRGAREAIRRLQRGRSGHQETQQLRHDLDELRDENRKLRDRLEAVEGRMNHGDNVPNGTRPATRTKRDSRTRSVSVQDDR